MPSISYDLKGSVEIPNSAHLISHPRLHCPILRIPPNPYPTLIKLEVLRAPPDQEQLQFLDQSAKLVLLNSSSYFVVAEPEALAS